MGREANFEFVRSTYEFLVIRDLGPWDKHFTVTNDADGVVARLSAGGHLPKGRRLFYFDSEGDLDELVIRRGRFVGFRCYSQDWPDQLKRIESSPA